MLANIVLFSVALMLVGATTGLALHKDVWHTEKASNRTLTSAIQATRKQLKKVRKWKNSHKPEVALVKCVTTYFKYPVPGLRRSDDFINEYGVDEEDRRDECDRVPSRRKRQDAQLESEERAGNSVTRGRKRQHTHKAGREPNPSYTDTPIPNTPQLNGVLIDILSRLDKSRITLEPKNRFPEDIREIFRQTSKASNPSHSDIREPNTRQLNDTSIDISIADGKRLKPVAMIGSPRPRRIFQGTQRGWIELPGAKTYLTSSIIRPTEMRSDQILLVHTTHKNKDSANETVSMSDIEINRLSQFRDALASVWHFVKEHMYEPYLAPLWKHKLFSCGKEYAASKFWDWVDAAPE